MANPLQLQHVHSKLSGVGQKVPDAFPFTLASARLFCHGSSQHECEHVPVSSCVLLCLWKSLKVSGFEDSSGVPSGVPGLRPSSLRCSKPWSLECPALLSLFLQYAPAPDGFRQTMKRQRLRNLLVDEILKDLLTFCKNAIKKCFLDLLSTHFFRIFQRRKNQTISRREPSWSKSSGLVVQRSDEQWWARMHLWSPILIILAVSELIWLRLPTSRVPFHRACGNFKPLKIPGPECRAVTTVRWHEMLNALALISPKKKTELAWTH